ncbi:hypothetical protein FRC16_008974 [Serendipita sp. 398]|nr:hypothetical protein FRC16_008974 [Serendipita sp. 398]
MSVSLYLSVLHIELDILSSLLSLERLMISKQFARNLKGVVGYSPMVAAATRIAYDISSRAVARSRKLLCVPVLPRTFPRL